MTRRHSTVARGLALVAMAVLVALGAGLPTGLAGAATPKADPAPTTTTVPATDSTKAQANASATYEQLAHCVSTSEHLYVVMLVDESGSLQKSDPKAVRVAAAKTALAGLVGLTDQTAGGANIDVQVAAFSNTYKPIGGFAPLTRASLPALQQSLDALKARNKGMDTDYTSALAGAREALAQQSVAVDDQSSEACKVVLLFTDGFYDLGIRSTAAERKEFGNTKPYAPGLELKDQATVTKIANLGIAALCDKGGVADQLRADQVTTLAVALTSNMRPSDQAFLQAVASGTGPKKKCGHSDGSRSGVFLPAFDPAGLIGTFDTVATRIAGGTPVGPPATLKTCVNTVCPEGQTAFTVDQSLRRVHIYVTVPNAQTKIEIKPPGQSALVLSDRTAATNTVGGTAITSSWPLPTAATIDLTVAPTSVGQWTVTLVDQSASGTGTVQVYTFSDLEPALVTTKPVQAGQAAELKAQVVSGLAHKAVNDLRQAKVTAVITDPISGVVTTLPMGTIGSQFLLNYTPPAATTSSVLRVVLRLNAVTKDGVKVIESSDPTNVATVRPKGFPLLTPTDLTPTAVSGKGSAVASMLVLNPVGSPPGCVWVAPLPTIISAPAGSQPMKVVVPSGQQTKPTCLHVNPTGSTPLEFHLQPNGRASGTVTGSVRIWSQAAKGAAVPTDVPFTFEMTRGIDKTKQLALFLVLLIAGIGLPLVLLIIMNVLSTRFQVLEYVQGANLPVVVHKNGQVLRTDADAAKDGGFHLYGYDFHPIPPSDSSKHFNFAGLRFAARPPANPFGVGYATAVPEGGAADVAREGRRVNLALSLAGSWIFIYDPDATNAATRRILGRVAGMEAPEVHGWIVAFIAHGPVPPQADRLVTDIYARLPRTARRMSELSHEGEQVASTRRSSSKPGKESQPVAGSPAADGPAADAGATESPAQGSAVALAEREPGTDPDAIESEPIESAANAESVEADRLDPDDGPPAASDD